MVIDTSAIVAVVAARQDDAGRIAEVLGQAEKKRIMTSQLSLRPASSWQILTKHRCRSKDCSALIAQPRISGFADFTSRPRRNGGAHGSSNAWTRGSGHPAKLNFVRLASPTHWPGRETSPLLFQAAGIERVGRISPYRHRAGTEAGLIREQRHPWRLPGKRIPCCIIGRAALLPYKCLRSHSPAARTRLCCACVT